MRSTLTARSAASMRLMMRRRGVASTSAISFGIQGINAVTGIILARSLGPSGRGVLAAIVLWAFLVQVVGGISLGDAAIFHIARTREQIRDIAVSATFLASIIGVILMAIAWPLVPAYVHSATAADLLSARLYLLWLPLNLVAAVGLSVELAAGHLRAFNVGRLGLALVTAAFLAAEGLSHTLNIRNAVLAYIASNGVLCMLVTAHLASVYGVSPPRRHLIRPLVTYGLKSHTGTLSGIANERADQAVVSLIMPSAQLGRYVVANTVASGITLVGYTLGLLAFPAIGSAAATQQRHLLRAFLQLCGGLSSILAIVLFAATPWILEVLFGRGFVSAADPTRILLIAGVVLSINRVCAAGLKGLNRPLAAGAAEMVALGATIGLLAVLVPRFGLVGAAVASLAAYGVSLCCMLLLLRRHFTRAAVRPEVPQSAN